MSKTVIVYYSATGNTLYLAKMFKDATLISINDIFEKNIELDEDVDRLGIFFPVYYMGLPYPVKKFIRDYLSSRDNSSLGYIFSLITYGSTPWTSSYILDRELQKIGLNISYVNCVKTPDMYLPLFKVKNEEEVNKLLKKEEGKINKIIKETEDEVIRLPHGIPFFSRISKRVSEKKNNPRENKKLSIDGEKCISCGICTKVCPMDNIEITEDGAEIKDECIFCFSCFHSCPNEAIVFPKRNEKYKFLVNKTELFKR